MRYYIESLRQLRTGYLIGFRDGVTGSLTRSFYPFSFILKHPSWPIRLGDQLAQIPYLAGSVVSGTQPSPPTPVDPLTPLDVKEMGYFLQWDQRPAGLTSADVNKLFLYGRTGTIHRWKGGGWEVLSDIVNVLDYGAIGDGVADDSIAIQKALNLNTKTLFPKGSYRVTQQLELNIPTTAAHRGCPQICGEGVESTKFINQVSNGSLFNYQQFQNQYFYFGYGLLFEDFLITGSGVPNSSGISISGAASPQFSRIKIEGQSKHGVVFPFDLAAPVEGVSPNQYINADAFSNFFSIFTSCSVGNCGGWGFYIDTSNSAINMTACYASGCSGGGLYLQSGASSITDCSFSYCGTYGDPKSGGIWLGDDYPLAKDGILKKSYATIFNVCFQNIEVDSNFNRQMFLTGYNHSFKNIRLIQGSLPSGNATYHNTPIQVQMGCGNFALTDSKFDGVTLRTKPGNPRIGTVFSDNLGYANNSPVGGSPCIRVEMHNVYDFFPDPATLTNYSFNHPNSQISVYERGINKYNYPTGIPTSGSWDVGTKILNANLTPESYTGWVCVTSGTPGTWKGYGLIAS
jgi:Pectate lyase superfamily protein